MNPQPAGAVEQQDILADDTVTPSARQSGSVATAVRPEVRHAAAAESEPRTEASWLNDAVLIGSGPLTGVRWREGERFEQLFESRCDWMRDHGSADHLAVDAGGVTLTFDELDARANQLARYLKRHGVRSGDRVGLLFDTAVHAYVGMLAVLKTNAAYVPLDIGFPADRVRYILQDASVRTVVSQSHLRDRIESDTAAVVCVDDAEIEISLEDPRRLSPAEKGHPVDELCYIVYTSGTTGRPKGVAIEHASICNFVRVAVDVYGFREQERVYQGMTIAFDFSVEEIWVPLLAGATLVPKPAGSTLLGAELGEFISDNRISALCCVPTLLATLDEDVVDLRFLLVSGEACPQDLIRRWYRPDRRFLNVYGPTEATVTATFAVVHPDRQVTLGVPLPTYTTLILDPDEDRALPRGDMGEIGIAGIGLARGYLNREDLTDRAFVPDFLGLPDNPSGRIYRTGDLARINRAGEIEYHGRIDTQVKIRGYRIELAEIESVLLEVPGVSQAVVDTYEPRPGALELVAYYTVRDDSGTGVDQHEVLDRLRERLPAYMVPAYLEHLSAIPMLPSNKADRKSLPPPSARTVGNDQDYIAPTTASETVLAELLAGVLAVDRVSIDSHFFDGLGANSLLMAHFCTAIRKHPDLPSVSIKDVYLNPTIRTLATALSVDPDLDSTSASPSAAPTTDTVKTRTDEPNSAHYVLCGAAQLLLFIGFGYLAALAFTIPLEWMVEATSFSDIYLRSAASAAVILALSFVLPVSAKWLLLGRCEPTQFPVWSLRYLRFWVVKMLILASPFAHFAGSPLKAMYLRALGARIGKGALILARGVPVTPDLLTIGAGAVIRKSAHLNCYRAEAGTIQTGRVTVGRDAFVGEATLLDINTVMGDDTQLGHTSSLHSGQAIPNGQRWHGSPARRTNTDYRVVATGQGSTARRFSFGTIQLLTAALITGPLLPSLAVTLFANWAWLRQMTTTAEDLHLTEMLFYVEVLTLSAALYFGGLLLQLLLITTLPRLTKLALQPGRTYRLYGWRYWLQRFAARRTNSKNLMNLFGDSSAIVYYLRALGYDLSHIEQSGSNFGMAVEHDSPYLSAVGTGTMVSDGLTFINADFSSTSFQMSRTAIGARNFLGNKIAYPAQGKTGDDCLLATKVMIPIDGKVRTGVGLLGSPAFEIPRSVQRDKTFHEFEDHEIRRRALAAKNRYNAATMGLHLLVRWFYFFGGLVVAFVSISLYDRYGEVAVQAALLTHLAVTVVYFTLVERLLTRRGLEPQFCSIYHPYFWWHERYWKVPAMTYIALFNGTPFKGALWRALGTKVGRRLFDDGCWMTERRLVSLGDDCTLNAGGILQGHSLEDGTFKSDRLAIGNSCTVGVGAFVHYGVRMEDSSMLQGDSFLMKGEELPPDARWWGNPATPMPVGPYTPQAALVTVTTGTGADVTPNVRAMPVRRAHPKGAHRQLAAASPNGRGRHRQVAAAAPNGRGRHRG